MATTSTPVSQTVQQRAVSATSQLRTILGLDDLKLLSVALTEAAIEELRFSPTFTARIRAIYDELAAAKPKRTPRVRLSSVNDVKLVPIGEGYDRPIDPSAPLDPYFLNGLYGANQLRLALTRYSVAKLKEGAAAVEQKNPGTKPASKARKDSLIDYIVEMVAGPGY